MTKKRTLSEPLLGAHMSIAGGFYKAIERADLINATTLQIFTKSNRQWQAKKISTQEIELFQKIREDLSIEPVIAHASYLINIGSPDKEIERKSVDALALELERCHQLAIPYLVLHPGSHTNSDIEVCLERIQKNLDILLEQSSGTTKISLETMAGQGSSVGYAFEQLACIRKESKHKKRIGVCLDTCHIFTAGYQFDTPKSYAAMWDAFDTTIGLSNLDVIHLNDSKKDLGSHVDRHEHIGKGKIGLKAFEFIMNDEKLVSVPKILETPKDSLDDDRRNMAILKGLIK